MTTPRTSSAGMRERSIPWMQDYESMATWELELIRQEELKYGYGLSGKPNERVQAELKKRRDAEFIESQWRQLERSGFGL